LSDTKYQVSISVRSRIWC